MNLSRILYVICLLITIHSNAQTKNEGCDDVYEKVDQLAQYKSGNKELLNDLTYGLLNDVFKKCIYNIEDAPTKLTIVLIIDANGNVIDAAFRQTTLSTSCQFLLKEKFLKMQGWKPAIKDGKRVCSKFSLPIACLKWVE